MDLQEPVAFWGMRHEYSDEHRKLPQRVCRCGCACRADGDWHWTHQPACGCVGYACTCVSDVPSTVAARAVYAREVAARTAGHAVNALAAVGQVVNWALRRLLTRRYTKL